MSEQRREVEIKFRAPDLDEIRRRLESIGAEYIGRDHEENLIFDDAAGRFRESNQLLRLRRDHRVTLTFKRSVPDPRFKVRTEIEIEVDSFEKTQALLEAAGFQVVDHYEKDRETWHCDGVKALLDELSFGQFVELEGEPPDLERIAALLGFDLSEGITKDYLTLRRESQAVGG